MPNKTERFEFRLEPHQKEFVVAYAAEKGTSVAKLLVEWIEDAQRKDALVKATGEDSSYVI